MAAIQFYFYAFGGLTSWKGGGFGMYSDPHPKDSRIIWLVGMRDGKQTAFRINPWDPKTNYDSIAQKPVADLLFQLETSGYYNRNFPDLMSFYISPFFISSLKEQIRDEPTLKHFPIDNIEIQLYQIEIDKSYKYLEAKLQHRSNVSWQR
jgi:hypothetical protein